MRIVRIFHFALAMALITLVGCATKWPDKDPGASIGQPPNGQKPERSGLEDVVFKFDSNGGLVPVTVDGKPYEPCADRGKKNVCRFYRDKVKISKINSISILQVEYSVNPDDCRYVKTIQNGIVEHLIHPLDRHKDC